MKEYVKYAVRLAAVLPGTGKVRPFLLYVFARSVSLGKDMFTITVMKK
jgi:hypothetical protein